MERAANERVATESPNKAYSLYTLTKLSLHQQASFKTRPARSLCRTGQQKKNSTHHLISAQLIQSSPPSQRIALINSSNALMNLPSLSNAVKAFSP
ncbi:hypothetical protein CDAR_417021 [Caerostris darwini]|uniref:Uncharacterized protein n=1 Tax=Caerostris darwini TaxID=1538125 RepID=A0AAV4X558_9ARAC|nr:hypothetical protein CDAR_417021 [Caerostris darwini]